jgi:hypothetical protein
MTNPRPQLPSIETATNADLRGSWPALLRAAERARHIAAQTGTAVVVVRNGVLEHDYPKPTLTVARPFASNEVPHRSG